MINFREEETKEIEKGFYLWYNIERYYTSAGSGRAKRGKLRTEPCASPGGFMSAQQIGAEGERCAQQTWYNLYIPAELFTPHVCRHTFCSNMAKSGMNPKTLQYLMGHSDIGVTLNTYTHIGYDDAKEELKRVVNAEQ